MADVALGKVRADRGQLMAALTGHVDDHHRFLLRERLTQIEHLEKAVERDHGQWGFHLMNPDVGKGYMSLL